MTDYEVTPKPVPARPHIIQFIQLDVTPNVLTVVTVCPMCHKVSLVNTEQVAMLKWLFGQHIQDVMPDLTNDERELLISGADECFDLLSEDED